MTRIDWAAVFADAWRRWRRDRQLLLPLAGLFLFLPQFAFYLLASPLPKLPADAATDAKALLAPDSPLVEWMAHNLPGFLIALLMMVFGAISVLTLYLDGENRALGEALKRAVTLLPRYLVAMIAVGLPAGLMRIAGPILFLPCLYLVGRVILTGAALVAERPIGVGAAIVRSFALTRRRGLAMTGFAALVLVLDFVVPTPFRLLHDSLQSGGTANPVAVAIIEAVGSGLASAVALATVLVQVSLYRRLASASREA